MELVFLKTVLSLGAVVGLMILILFPLKKYFYGNRVAKGQSVPVDILGHRMLQPKRSVYVLKVMNAVIVVGVTDAGMQTLVELPDGALHQEAAMSPAAAAESSSTQRTAAGGVSFAEYLHGSLRGMIRDVRRPNKQTADISAMGESVP